jgi:hypothetical protein
MPTYADLRMAPPRSWDEFEDITCSAAKNHWLNPNFTRHGRQGQAQHGVDIFSQSITHGVFGIQCKNTWASISTAVIESEIDNAEEFRPSLSHLYIATTAETDAKIQREVLKLSLARADAGKFSVSIWFWHDVWQDLTRDTSRLFQHFPQLQPVASIETHDQRLFRELQAWLPYEPTVRFVQEFDFGNAFARTLFWPIIVFAEDWPQPNREFIDATLQDAHAALTHTARELASLVAIKTGPVGNGDFNSVLSDSLRQAGQRPQWVRDDAALLNAQSANFAGEYADFIRLCKRRLLA